MSDALVRRSGTGWCVLVGPYQIGWFPTRDEARDYARELAAEDASKDRNREDPTP